MGHLQKLMRHEDIKTTFKYYADVAAEDLASRIQSQLQEGGQKGGQTRKKAKSN